METRRNILKSLAGAAAVAAIPSPVVEVFARTPAEPSKKQESSLQQEAPSAITTR